MRTSGRAKAVVDVAASVAMLLAAAVIIWNGFGRQYFANRNREKLPRMPIELTADTPMRGKSSVQTVVLEFSDFECPFCGKFAKEVLPWLEENYVVPGRTKLAFIHLPLREIHPFAGAAAESAACAEQQGQFWPFHDLLFVDRRRLAPEDLASNAAKLGLNLDRFRDCLSAEATSKGERYLELAQSLNIVSTPTLVFGRIQENGQVVPVERLPISDTQKLRVALDRLIR